MVCTSETTGEGLVVCIHEKEQKEEGGTGKEGTRRKRWKKRTGRKREIP